MSPFERKDLYRQELNCNGAHPVNFEPAELIKEGLPNKGSINLSFGWIIEPVKPLVKKIREILPKHPLTNLSRPAWQTATPGQLRSAVISDRR